MIGYSGLVSREYSSGNRIQRGAITKTGNAHLRRVLVEAAWTYRHSAGTGVQHQQRQKDLPQVNQMLQRQKLAPIKAEPLKPEDEKKPKSDQ